MGLEASCLVPHNANSGNQVSSNRWQCTSVGGNCFTPQHAACMEHYDARSIRAKSSDARPGRFQARPQTPWDEAFLPCPRLPTGACCSTQGVVVQLEARYGSVAEATGAARRHGKRDELREATMAYSVAMEMEEDNAALCDEFGQFMLSHGELDWAEILFSRALALDPLNPEYCYRHGVVLQQRRQPRQAAESFMNALRQDPRFVGALFNLGVTHRELGDPGSASDDFRRILQIDPKNHCAMALLGECLAELGDLDGAVRALEDAVALDPTNRSAQKDLDRLRALAATSMTAPV
eukprot:CAMPEP_0170585072 /NCGR_PEP_ID=MMETSP0224-20130122/9016_1 /TAXON_ID=285029 /ORGANISM="Togula jolla, Strain CCCM 725" /LENGTH=293 /DNA_ID=CAMNT_0010908527 /DNA_START=32 /DNA_END=913 /DNA_ORIENTATION=+